MPDHPQRPESVDPTSGELGLSVIPKVARPSPNQATEEASVEDWTPPPLPPEDAPPRETLPTPPTPTGDVAGETAPEAVPSPGIVEAGSPFIEGIDWDAIADQCKRAAEGSFDFDPAEVVDGMEGLMSQDGPLGMALDEHRDGDAGRQAVKVTALPPANVDLWFIGDIHGDLLGMLGSLAYLEHASEARGKVPWVIYLGDFFDRGPHGHEVMLTLFHHVLQSRERVSIIIGNHDESLQYGEESKKFHALVKPCEYADWLNEQQEQGHDLATRTGRLSIELFQRSPRAFFFPDGLFVAHGGVHHRDKFSDDRGDLELEDFNSLNDSRCLTSFVWKRASSTEPRKRVNPSSSSGEFGYKDFYQFCERASELLGQPVKHMIRGHDHHPERFFTYPKHVEHRMLGINNMCYSQGELDPFERMPCIARWIEGGYPQVHRVRIPSQHILEIHGKGD